MKSPMVAILVVAWLGVWGVAPAWADDAMLTVVQDESTMEQVIARHLRTTHQLQVDEKNPKGNDLWLDLPMKGDPMPGFHIRIDTQPLNRDPSGTVIERGILVTLLTGITVSGTQVDRLSRLLNDFNRRKAFSSAFIDTDRQIVLEWILNVLPPGLPTEYAYDIVAREDKLWRGLYPDVAAALK